jgi:hypothetical protein
MDVEPSRKRRIVRTVVLMLALPLLLLTGYVSTWIAVSKSARENFISQNTALTLRPAFAPLIRFCDSESPGGAELNRLWWTINPRKIVGNGDVQMEYATSALALAPSDLTVFGLVPGVELHDPSAMTQPEMPPRPIAR